MRRTPGHLVAAALFVSLLGFGACSDDGGEGGASTTAFCDAYTAIDESDFATSDLTSSEEVRQATDGVAPLFETLRRSAPPEIESDAGAVADAFTASRSFFERIDYDEARFSEATPEELADLEVMVGGSDPDTPIGQFVEANCGIDLEPVQQQFSSIGNEL